MKEIIFRGQFVDTKKWMYGSLNILDWEGRRIYSIKPFNSPMTSYEVMPDTVGQYIGKDDKNGKQLFRGDIYETERGNTRVIYYSEDDTQFKARSLEADHHGEYISDHCVHNPAEFGVKVIGNTYDDPATPR